MPPFRDDHCVRRHLFVSSFGLVLFFFFLILVQLLKMQWRDHYKTFKILQRPWSCRKGQRRRREPDGRKRLEAVCRGRRRGGGNAARAAATRAASAPRVMAGSSRRPFLLPDETPRGPGSEAPCARASRSAGDRPARGRHRSLTRWHSAPPPTCVASRAGTFLSGALGTQAPQCQPTPRTSHPDLPPVVWKATCLQGLRVGES